MHTRCADCLGRGVRPAPRSTPGEPCPTPTPRPPRHALGAPAQGAAPHRHDRHPPGHRRVAGQGQEDRQLPRPGLRRRVEPSATSATCRATPPTCRPATRARPGRGSASTSTTTSQTLYVVSADKRQQVAKLKDLLKDADELFLATDEDREGEAIAWHLLETLKPKVPVRRMVFHEITPQAIQHAVETPRELDRALVDAQETRRVLDRLYGYEVSPVLWKKVMPKLSAGRVQSVATRVVVTRERERMAFRQAEYWDVEGHFLAAPDATDPTAPRKLTATLHSLDGKRLATGGSFEQTTGQLKAGADVVLLDEATRARPGRAAGRRRRSPCASTDEKPYTRKPYAPFMTSTLQQEGGRKLRFSAQRVMQTAQRLYENGYITYMRTDSTNLSETAVNAARSQARELYGPEYVPDAPRRYASKGKNAQEAHEAIRPSGDVFRTPGELARELSGDELRLYELIWQRTVASPDGRRPRRDRVASRLGARRRPTARTPSSARPAASSPSRASCAPTSRAPTTRRPRRTTPSAACRGSPRGDALDVDSARPVRATRRARRPATPRRRWSSGSRSSASAGRRTYASIITTIQDRGYVWKKGSALVPTWLAFAVVNLLEQHFDRLVDYGFTASLEDDLDVIAGGEGNSVEWLSRFYFGSTEGKEGGLARQGGLKAIIGKNLDEIDARAISTIPIGLAEDGRDGRRARRPLRPVRAGRRGRLATSSRRPRCPRTSPRTSSPSTRPSSWRTPRPVTGCSGTDPTTGYDVVAKAGRYGPYVSADAAGGVEGQAADGVAVQDDGPRDAHPRAGAEAAHAAPRARRRARTARRSPRRTAATARTSARARRAARSRPRRQLFDVTLEQALALLAQPKQYGRKAAAPEAAAQGARRRPGQRRADGRQGGPLRPVRHRRRDERQPAQGRHARVADRRAGQRPAGRAARPRPGTEEDRQEGRPRRRPRRRPPRRRRPAKKAAAKKAPAQKKT